MTARGVLVRAYNRWLSFKTSHERSVKNIALRNDRKAFETIFGSPDLLAEYLVPERFTFYDEIADFCTRFEPRRVVDVGCGTGHLLAAIAARIELDEMVGVDYAQAAIDRLHEVLPSARGVVASLPDVELGGERFDLVLCTEVLEHVERPSASLSNLATLCSEGGRLVVTVPDGAHDTWEAHVNFWTADELQGFLSTVGESTVTHTRGGDLLGVVLV